MEALRRLDCRSAMPTNATEPTALPAVRAVRAAKWMHGGMLYGMRGDESVFAGIEERSLATAVNGARLAAEAGQGHRAGIAEGLVCR